MTTKARTPTVSSTTRVTVGRNVTGRAGSRDAEGVEGVEDMGGVEGMGFAEVGVGSSGPLLCTALTAGRRGCRW
ncbi:hypothetical protein SCA03_33330 [Streptomyces cacaoi]|uniref:Uncharacterized protein n=1 Tax=Streptomyces cacaoi TaxID=1898 RepID=A0A4Y3R005_STRCI|nr:hypothetical protein SCA03_33330 [Streptomyces cacaoi]